MLKKFTILNQKDMQALDNQNDTILLNLDHVVSIKIIKMIVNEEVIDGYWIRMSNGKKYRAVEIPTEVTQLLA